MSRAENVTIDIQLGRGSDSIDCRHLAADLVRRQVAVIVAVSTVRGAGSQVGHPDDTHRLHRLRMTRLGLVLSPASPGRAAT